MVDKVKCRDQMSFVVNVVSVAVNVAAVQMLFARVAALAHLVSCLCLYILPPRSELVS